MSDLIVGIRQALQRAEGFAARHPHALTGSVLGALSAFAITAFGIAPYAPDATELPRSEVVQTVALGDLQSQLDALAAHDFTLSRSDSTRSQDTADSLLKRLGAFDSEAARFLRDDELGRQVLQGRAGKQVQVMANAQGQVKSMVVRFPAASQEQQASHFSRLTIERKPSGQFGARLETVPLQSQIRLGSGSIESSLFAATDNAGIPDAVASQLADMFSGELDFHRELRKGDRFSLVYETLTADGEPVNWTATPSRLLAAEFVNNGRTLQAMWFNDPSSKKGGFYGFDGQSKRRTFLASPLEFSRVTSGFAMRFHPVLRTWRQHLGTDYGAPTGTPVRTVGDGVVEFAGRQNGFGNVVYIKHNASQTTVYAHLSRIDVKKGQRIEQGQRLGAVGATGWATGPHLHFEFRVNGQHKDPLTIARASEAVALASHARPAFQAQLATVRTKLESAATVAQGVVGD
ncbi:peptidoglycan DD-metalloendopeptidase family protein [Roseateles rivi]|uniref:peptidoglycan DD-metalloendopeptidase family protein n=1 Tax=Roseateles rivi TaxID=3299028 RepID=UPI003B019AE6